ncbi:MAG: hypothetical protein J6X91_01270 [Bacteroidales bacterium]|nr:hypothetical protein [Bacteroidales bacterium]
MNKEFDEQLLSLEGLTWLPWVGQDYSNGKRRLLIVAESHYVSGDDDIQKSIEEVINYREYTRDVIQECPIGNEWSNSMFENLHRTLFLNESFNSSSFWENVAFYNFVQRPMDYSKKERPTNSDFCKGWSTFVSLIDILKPTDCLFVGVSASYYFESSMSTLGVEHSSVKWLAGSSSAYGRSFSLTRDWGTIPILGIQHTSKYFSYDIWHNFLLEQNKTLMRYIYSLAGLNINPSVISIDKTKEKTWLQSVPSRMHKSILACDYTKIEEDSDALYITVGRSQYDNDYSASVKIWRWSEEYKRWKRSDDIPIARVGDLALMLASSIKTFQTLDYGSGFTYLKEDFSNEEDVGFLKKCIHENGPRIRESLSELKRLLNEIDLNKI